MPVIGVVERPLFVRFDSSGEAGTVDGACANERLERPVVHELDLHRGAEDPSLDREAELP